MAAEAADALYPATPDLDAKSLGSSSNTFCSEGPRMHVTFFEASGGSAFAFAQTAQVACNPGTRAALSAESKGKKSPSQMNGLIRAAHVLRAKNWRLCSCASRPRP